MHSSQDLGYYLNVLKRRYLYLLVPFILVLGSSVMVALFLPPVYRSSAKILIESQKIPTDLVRSTVLSLADERIQIIEQRVMTRDNLLKIANKFNVFGGKAEELSSSEMVEKMREQIAIARVPLAFRNRNRRGGATIAFTVSFEHRNPVMTVKVTNEIVTLILNEDVRARTSRASDTTKFLKREADRLEKQLAAIEAQVTEFKQNNKNSLPESLEFRLTTLQRLQGNLKDIDRELLTIDESKKLLELQFSALVNGTDVTGASTGNSSLKQLETLKSELLRKSALYAESHPEIKQLKRQVSALEENVKIKAEEAAKTVANEDKAGEKVDPKMPPIMAIKISSLNSRSAQLNAQREKLMKDILNIKQTIARTPEVERGLTSLTRRYENKQKSFRELLNKQQQALLGEKLEENKQAEHFEILEQPVIPQQPIKPDRKKFIGIGFLLAMAAGGGGILLIEMFNKSIRSGADLIESLNRHPLVSIPYIKTRSEMRRSRRRLVVIFIIATILSIVGLMAVHFFYMNLDILFLKVIARLQE